MRRAAPFSAKQGVSVEKRHTYVCFDSPENQALVRAVNLKGIFNQGKVPF